MKCLGFWAVVGLLILAPATWAAESDAKKEKPTPVTVPVFSLSGSYTEVPIGDDLLFGAAGTESFEQLLARLKKVRDDKDVKAVVVLASGTGLGNGQLEEVRAAMDDIKKAGKEIYAHADSLTMRSYVLLSGATRISVVPTGDLWLTGMYGQSPYLRGLLDKIGVEPDFLTCGDYKSAGEMFTRKEPSPEADENMNWLVDGIFEGYVELIADGRGTTPETVRKWIDVGLYGPDKAKELGIIDAVEFRNDFEKNIQSKFGASVKFDKKFAKKKENEIDFSSPFGILKFYADLLAGPKKTKSTKDAIAIVYVEGPIAPGQSDPSSFPFGGTGIAYSTPIGKALDQVANDDTVKAVVLRVNSPGGSAVASEIILQATRRVKAKKPFVVSMGDVAGSGGYYVACGADTIFADASTITASIGVVAGKLATADMWEKIGVHWKAYERGENAGILGSGEPFSDKQRDALQSWMNEVYEVFKGHVIAIRGGRLKKDLEEMAGGRVYTGRQALELGLVDKIGGLDAAISHAADQAGLKQYEIRIVPRPKNFAELIMEGLGGDTDDDTSTISLSSNPALGRQAKSLVDLAIPYLRGVEPQRLRLIQQALSQLSILQREQVMLTTPVVHIGDR